jgi:putative DNA primase/helicase
MRDRRSIFDALDYVSSDGDYFHWLRILAALWDGLGPEGETIAREWSAQSDRYESKSFKSAWRGAPKLERITVGTLFYEAKKNGWRPDKKPLSHRRFKSNHRTIDYQSLCESFDQKAFQARLVYEKAAPIARECDFAYLSKKSITAMGDVRIGHFFDKPALVVPIYGVLGPYQDKIQSIQWVLASGKKIFLKGAKKAGGAFPAAWRRSGSVVVCEGYATGVTLAQHYCPDDSVVCAFDAHNLVSVAVALRQRFPEADIIIAGDNDRKTPGNPGVTAACKAARLSDAVAVAIPHFDYDEAGSDWNDRWRLDLKAKAKFTIEEAV